MAVVPAGHRLAAHKAIRPEDLAHEIFISATRLAPIVRSAVNDYAAKVGITLKHEYDAENVTGAMSLVASIGGVSIPPLNTASMLIPSVVVRPLKGVPPTVDLMMGYNKSNMSPLLKRFLFRADELVKRVSQKHGFGARTLRRH